jgi:DNA polymerase-3 subunit gamma/tau
MDAIESSDPQMRQWAAACEAEQLQIYWQILIHGRRDLPLAPDQQSGLTMSLLRLHAFRPLAEHANPAAAAAKHKPAALAAQALTLQPSSSPTSRKSLPKAETKTAEPKTAEPRAAERGAAEPRDAEPRDAEPGAAESGAAERGTQDTATKPASFVLDCEWSALASRIPCSGFVRQFLEQSELLAIEGMHIRVRVPIRPLAELATVNKVKDLLVAHFQKPLRLSAEVGAVGVQTAASIHDAQRRAERDAALQGLQSDPFVQAMVNELGAQIDPDSVQPRQHESRKH